MSRGSRPEWQRWQAQAVGQYAQQERAVGRVAIPWAIGEEKNRSKCNCIAVTLVAALK